MSLFSLQGQTPMTEPIRKEATITMKVEGVATQEAAGAGAGSAPLELGEFAGVLLDLGVGVDEDGDFAGIGETTGALANGDGDSGDCEGAGGLVKGDGEISDPGLDAGDDAGDPDGTSDMCGVMATGDGPGAPVGASLNGDGANVGVSALGGEDFTGTCDGPGAPRGEPLGVMEIGAGEIGDNDGPSDEAGGSALGDGDFDGAGDGLLCATGDGALGDIAGGCDTGVGACFGLPERTTTVSFCPFRQLSSFPLMKK